MLPGVGCLRMLLSKVCYVAWGWVFEDVTF